MALGNMNDISEAIRAAAESKNEEKRWIAIIETVQSETVKGMFPDDTFFGYIGYNGQSAMRFNIPFEEFTELSEIIEKGPHFQDIININIKYNL